LKNHRVFLTHHKVKIVTVILIAVLAALAGVWAGRRRLFAGPDSPAALRIYDWQTGALYAEAPAKAGGKLFFGWIHSLEKIPWNEYYHIDENLTLVLDAITFPAFGAGIPENKGRVCYVKDGLIHMEQIEEEFAELVWLNSHSATRDIILDGQLVARGDLLPQHRRVRLIVERGGI
jgi:hypothetical protein